MSGSKPQTCQWLASTGRSTAQSGQFGSHAVRRDKYHDVAVILDASHVLALLDKEPLPVLAKREALLHLADLWETVRPYSVCSQVRQKTHLLRGALLTALQPVRVLVGPDDPHVRKPFLLIDLVVNVAAALEDLAGAMRRRRCDGVQVALERQSERYDAEKSSWLGFH